MKSHKIIIVMTVVAAVAAVAVLSLWRAYPESTTEGDNGSRVEPGMIELAPDAAARYTHPTLGFSFDKPKGYAISSIPEDDGSETIVVQKDLPSEASAKDGFQIFIIPLDEPLVVTPERVKSDLPGTTVVDPQKIALDGEGEGMMFMSNNDAYGGKSFEIWFTASGYLYEISTYQEFALELKKIIGTWQF